MSFGGDEVERGKEDKGCFLCLAECDLRYVGLLVLGFYFTARLQP